MCGHAYMALVISSLGAFSGGVMFSFSFPLVGHGFVGRGLAPMCGKFKLGECETERQRDRRKYAGGEEGVHTAHSRQTVGGSKGP